MDIEGLRKLVREMKKDQTLILAPDVYDSLAMEMGHGPEIMGVAGSHSIRIQRSVALKPGTAMVMAEAHFNAPQSWAGSFLSKNGPGSKKAEMIDLGLVVPDAAHDTGLASAPPGPAQTSQAEGPPAGRRHMMPPGTPVASVILSSFHTEPSGDALGPYLKVYGSGVLAPGVVISNEWWDRTSLLVGMEVSKPAPTNEGHVQAINFQARCALHHIEELRDLVDSGIRELIEREVVPPLLIKLGMMGWPYSEQPLLPVTSPFGMPTDWDPPPRSNLAPAGPCSTIWSSSRSASPRVCRGNRVLQEAVEHGMLANPGLVLLVAKAGLAPPAVAENSGPVVRRHPGACHRRMIRCVTPRRLRARPRARILDQPAWRNHLVKIEPEDLLACAECMTAAQKASFCELMDPVQPASRGEQLVQQLTEALAEFDAGRAEAGYPVVEEGVQGPPYVHPGQRRAQGPQAAALRKDLVGPAIGPGMVGWVLGRWREDHEARQAPSRLQNPMLLMRSGRPGSTSSWVRPPASGSARRPRRRWAGWCRPLPVTHRTLQINFRTGGTWSRPAGNGPSVKAHPHDPDPARGQRHRPGHDRRHALRQGHQGPGPGVLPLRLWLCHRLSWGTRYCDEHGTV